MEYDKFEHEAFDAVHPPYPTGYCCIGKRWRPLCLDLDYGEIFPSAGLRPSPTEPELRGGVIPKASPPTTEITA